LNCRVIVKAIIRVVLSLLLPKIILNIYFFPNLGLIRINTRGSLKQNHFFLVQIQNERKSKSIGMHVAQNKSIKKSDTFRNLSVWGR